MIEETVILTNPQSAGSLTEPRDGPYHGNLTKDVLATESPRHGENRESELLSFDCPVCPCSVVVELLSLNSCDAHSLPRLFFRDQWRHVHGCPGRCRSISKALGRHRRRT